jgi:hypothetical protein
MNCSNPVNEVALFFMMMMMMMVVVVVVVVVMVKELTDTCCDLMD